MSDIAIRVKNLGKRYCIGAVRKKHDTLRDAIMNFGSRIANLTRPFSNSTEDTIWALKDVSMEVNQGEVVGIIGQNGAGKSTLLKVVSRISEPTEGYIEIYGRASSLLEVGIGFHPELTGRENIYLNGAILGMKKGEINNKFDEIVAFAEIEKFLYTPVKHYSSGMYVRLAFAVAAHLETDILLVDEVLAVGDATFQKKCLGKLGGVAKEGRTVLFVSHNMAAIQHLCKAAFVLSKGRLIYAGSVTEAIDFYEQHIMLKNERGKYPPNIIFDFDMEYSQLQVDFEIVRLETLDLKGLPKSLVSTWDSVRFRISYIARRNVHTASVVLQISTRYGAPLLHCSTQPDSTIPLSIKTGFHIAECDFISLPLSAGEYIIGAGLAIPNKEWLCWREQLGWLTVNPKDVYQSGTAPTAARSIIATPHIWRVK